MSVEKAPALVGRDVVHKQVVEVLKDMTGDWDIDFTGEVGGDTWLVADLAFESIDVVHLIVTLGEVYQEKDLGFESILIEDGRYVTDLRVGQVVDFLHRTLAERGTV